MTSPLGQSPDEIFDVVDEHDCVIRQATRAEVHANRWLHRAVHIFVFNTQGQVLLQKRSRFKDTSPLKWTTSCSGHVDSGESYDTAALRELGEEIGISVPDLSALQLIARHPPCPQTGYEFIQIYRTESDRTPTPNLNEIDALEWMSVETVNTLLAEQPETFSPAFSLVWGLLNQPLPSNRR